jgi:hypothetical protein
VIIFSSIRFLSKKSNQTKKKIKKKTETGFGSVRFGFLGQKPVQTGLARFFNLARFFSGLGSVRFGFFLFQAYKIETEPNRSVFLKF